MKIPTYVVDAFASEAFKGNPAGVCVLSEKIPDALMQKIAMEMKHAETAFVLPLEQKSLADVEKFSLRWFTPTVEVELCGHATLGTAATLFTRYGARAKKLAFETLSGTLTVEKSSDDSYVLDFPKQAPKRTSPVPGLLEALGVAEANETFNRPNSFVVVRVSESASLPSLAPDFASLKSIQLPENGHGVIVTRKGPAPYDFTSRMFAPGIGIDEDPVTGAAHTVLAPYWADELKKTKMRAYQASPRGGEVGVEIAGERVLLTGRAVVVLSGELTL